MRLRSASFRRAYSKLMELVAVLRAIRHGEESEIGPRAILGHMALEGVTSLGAMTVKTKGCVIT